MFKTEVVDSGNIRKTVVYKIAQIILIAFLLFFITLPLHILGQNSAIESFFRNNNASIVQPVAMAIIVIALIFSMIMKARMKNPKVLGSVKLDENEFNFLGIDNMVQSYSWGELEGINFEFFSTVNRNNPRGCCNYLTLLKYSNQVTYEIVIENSLSKSELGELLREINKKIPVKIKYALLMKKIFPDNDLKLK
jgi:hypothetical protein